MIVFLIFWCMSLDNRKILSCRKPLLELFVFISEVDRFYFNIYLGKRVFYKFLQSSLMDSFFVKRQKKFIFLVRLVKKSIILREKRGNFVINDVLLV